LMNVGVKNELIGYTSPKSNRWRLAADAASACIDLAVSNGYSLYNKYSDATENYKQMWFDTSNPEVLFAREGTTSANNEALPCIDQYNFPNGYGGWGGNCPIQEFVDAFEMKDGTKFDWTNKEEAANPYANRDPRLHASVLCNGDEFASRNLETFINEGEKGGGKDSKFGNDSWNTSLTGYNMRKFLNPAYVGNSWNMPYRRDWIWLRLGEQYLNLAEALYECNDEDGARNALNVIRKRAGMPDVTDTGIALLERIRNERRVELCFEEHRYFDVRRWKLGDEYLNKTVHGIKIIKKSDGSYTYDPTVVVQERKFIERMYWLPLPQAELDKNPNLIQNPGYSSGDK
nr:RagB/SusD family nutrient uptake outer membrane protein [Prevotella sp.]